MATKFSPVAKIRFYCLMIILFLIACSLILMFLSMIPPVRLIARSVEQPIVTEYNKQLITGISQVVSDENNLYILFGRYSIVGVYTLDGEYQYTIGIYNHTNGRTEIAARNGSLYICDKIENVYTFQDGALIDFTDRTESYPLRKNTY